MSSMLFIIFLGPMIAQANMATTKDLLAKRTYCGYQHTDDYVRESDQISIDEYPWLTQLQYGTEKLVLCTGSLINNRYVLTAAHCLLDGKNPLLGVRLGDYNVKTDKDCVEVPDLGIECSDPYLDVGIELKMKHPIFNPKTSVHDIGLIRLANNVQFSDYIRPICLPNQEQTIFTAGQEVETSGWGVTQRLGNATEVKKRVISSVIANDECRRLIHKYFPRKSVTDFHVCASELKRGIYTCHGDGGAPLMVSIKSQWNLAGVISFGGVCGDPYPTVYTKVDLYIEWIKAHLSS